MPVTKKRWSWVVWTNASLLTTVIDENKFIMEGAMQRQIGKEIWVAAQLWVSHRSINPRLLPESFFSRSLKARRGSSTMIVPADGRFYNSSYGHRKCIYKGTSLLDGALSFFPLLLLIETIGAVSV